MSRVSTASKIFIGISLVGALTCCGSGGGSSGSGSGNGSSDLTACLNFSAPSAVTMHYAGNSTAAVLDEASAVPMASKSLLIMLQLGNVIPTLPIDSTVTQESCLTDQSLGGSGTVKSLTFVQSDESGWADFQYNNYIYDAYTINGTSYATFSPVASNALQVKETVSLYAYHIVIPSYIDITLNGTINITVQRNTTSSPYNFATPVSANLIIVDNLNKTTTWINNYTYADTTLGQPSGSAFVSRTLSGKLYDSQLGYVDLATVNAISYSGLINNPVNGYSMQQVFDGGPITLVGGGPAVAYLTPLNVTLFSVALDQNGDGDLEESVRINQSDLQPDVTPWPNLVGPVPIAAVDNQSMSPPLLGQALPLEGLRSYSPSGSYVTFSWTESFAPPGSTAVLTNSQSATPSFIPDLPGDYCFKLTVSDGISSNTDEVVVTVQTSANNGIAVNYANVTGPYIQAHVGQTVTLDGRASVDGSAWKLIAPPGSRAQLSDPSDDPLRPQFTPDIPGFYFARLETLGSGAFDTLVIPQQVIAVDTNIDFHKAVMLTRGSVNPAANFVAGDFNDDGIPDIAVIDASMQNLIIYYGSKSGGFNAPVSIALPPGGNFTYMAAKDINNDGLTDILIGGSGTYVFLQQADGTLAGPLQVAANSTCGSLLLAVGQWKSDTTNSIYTTGDNCIDVYNAISSTQFASSETFPFNEPGAVPLAQIASVTGDNLVDMLVYNESDVNNPTIDVFAGQTDGSFSKQASYLIPGAGDQLVGGEYVVGDFNHDGLQDIAATANSNIDVLLQKTGGGFTSFVQYPVLAGTGLWSGAITAGDLNSDGYTDLVEQQLGYQYPDLYSGYNTSAIWYTGILFQNSSQTFNPEVLYPFNSTQEPSAPLPISTQVVDLNGDGLPDIIMLDSDGDLIILYQRPFN